MSYSNVPPPSCLSGVPQSRSQSDDRRKDEEKVQEVSSVIIPSINLLFSTINWQKATKIPKMIKTMKSKVEFSKI